MDSKVGDESRSIKVKDLGLAIRPKVRIGEHVCELYEISERNLTVFAPKEATASNLGSIHEWQVQVHNTPICGGTAEVLATSPARNGLRIALRVSSSALDLPEFIRQSRHAEYRAQLRSGVVSSDAIVPEPYKVFCAEVSSTLRGYRRLADAIDNDSATVGKPVSAALFEECAQHMMADWKRFSLEGTSLCLPYMENPEIRNAMRAFTGRLVTSEVMQGALWRRAYEKPRGYPGDYGVMNYIYESQDLGETTYARLCHRTGLDWARFVRARKDVVKEVLLQKLSKGKPFACTSIACGSAHEIFEIAQQASLSAPFTATLLDQDPEALTFATRRLEGLLARHGNKLQVNARPARFGDFTDRGDAVPDQQDLIYCFGMFDYLPYETVAKITSVLYGKLRSGGSLILGNVKAPTEQLWDLCMMLGYDIWFRDEQEMFALAKQFPDAHADLQLEPTGHNYLLFVHKRDRQD